MNGIFTVLLCQSMVASAGIIYDTGTAKKDLKSVTFWKFMAVWFLQHNLNSCIIFNTFTLYIVCVSQTDKILNRVSIFLRHPVYYVTLMKYSQSPSVPTSCVHHIALANFFLILLWLKAVLKSLTVERQNWCRILLWKRNYRIHSKSSPVFQKRL